MFTSAKVDGQTVRVGDYVCFKSDVEQCGRVVKIRQNSFGQPELVLEREGGFSGDYIGGQERTVQSASDCWVE
jgi:hypothetical protein